MRRGRSSSYRFSDLRRPAPLISGFADWDVGLLWLLVIATYGTRAWGLLYSALIWFLAIRDSLLARLSILHGFLMRGYRAP